MDRTLIRGRSPVLLPGSLAAASEAGGVGRVVVMLPTLRGAKGGAPAFCRSQRGGHLFGTGGGGVIVNFECGDELANDPSTDFQLVVREGFFVDVWAGLLARMRVTLRIEYGIGYPRTFSKSPEGGSTWDYLSHDHA